MKYSEGLVKFMRQCPRCASELNIKDKVCPRCKLPVSKMEKSEETLAEELEKQAESKKLNRAQKKEKKRLAKLAKKEAKKQRKLAESISNTDFSQFATNSEHDSNNNNNEILPKFRKKNSDKFQFEIDENGEFYINTKDVEIIGEETAKILEEKRQQTYSIKKARGDYKPPKIKWWELYKIADRAFARRKIKKEIAKASKVKPDFISKGKLLTLAIFGGWFGAHNFYAKNKKKGFLSLGFCITSVVGMFLNNVPFFKAIELWLIGFTAFVVLAIWSSDIINIIFNKFTYRIQKEKFISSLNIETRAKLGEKYIDLELLRKPWWVRFKVWCDKKKKNYAEWKKERRQALIEKEKAKLEKQEEKNKIENEVAEFEKKELEQIEKAKTEAKVKRPARGSKNVQKANDADSELKTKIAPKKKTAKVTVANKSKSNTKNNTKKK